MTSYYIYYFQDGDLGLGKTARGHSSTLHPTPIHSEQKVRWLPASQNIRKILNSESQTIAGKRNPVYLILSSY